MGNLVVTVEVKTLCFWQGVLFERISRYSMIDLQLRSTANSAYLDTD